MIDPYVLYKISQVTSTDAQGLPQIPETGPASFTLLLLDSAKGKGKEARVALIAGGEGERRVPDSPPVSRYSSNPCHYSNPYRAGLEGILLLRSIDVISQQSYLRRSMVRGLAPPELAFAK
jgi:hypothetical protein